jgi:pimeloyl-ACP methyl ester carboxylesterase
MRKYILRAMGAGINLVSIIAPKRAGALAFDLFCKPPKPVVRNKERKFLQTAKQTSHQVNGINYLLYEWSQDTKPNAPIVLCAYGWAYNAGRWRHFVPQLLEAGFRVLAFDPPGHGDCPGSYHNLYNNAKIIAQIIENEGKPHAIIAHSFGGSSSILGLEMLPKALHPDQFVMMASFSSPAQIFEEYATYFGLRKVVLEQMIACGTALIGRPLRSVDMAQITASYAYINALIVHDPKDLVTPYTHTERYIAHWPGSKLLQAHGAGHHLGTNEVTNAVIAWVTEPVCV